MAVLFATPAHLWRQGDRVFIPVGGELPPYCIKCGEPADNYLHRKFTWHHPLLYLLIFWGFLPYVIVALIVRKKMEVEVPMCKHHGDRWSVLRRVEVIFAIAFFPAGVLLGIAFDSFGIGILAVAVLAIAAGALGSMTSTLKAHEIDANQGVFTGACEAFLVRLDSPSS